MDPVTPTDFLAAKTQFASVGSAVVQGYLDAAEIAVDGSWPEKLYKMAVIAFTCHLMTLDGKGTDAASIAFGSGVMDIQSFKSGSVTLTRFSQQSVDFTFVAWLNRTTCGTFYSQLLNMAKSGPRIASGAVDSRRTAAWGW